MKIMACQAGCRVSLG